MFKILKQPYPSNLVQFDLPNIKAASVAGISVFFVLVMLRPFGLYNFSMAVIIRNAFIFAMVTFLGVNLNLVIFKLINRRNSILEERWTVGAEVAMQMWILFFIGTLNSLTDHFVCKQPLTWSIFVRWLLQTVVVGTFPSLIFVFIRQYRLLKTYSANAQVLEAKLSIAEPHEIFVEEQVNNKLIFFGEETSSGDVPINPSAVMYIVAADNYIRVFYTENQVLKNVLVRGTLKGAEEKLGAFDNFYRCHRSYLVNLNYIRHISGNATGYKLHLDGTDELIPVSRSLNNEISEKINTILAV